MKRLLRRLFGEESGQDLIEYSLLVAFVALSSAGLMISSGADVNQVWSSANSVLSQAAGPAQTGHHHHGDGGGD